MKLYVGLAAAAAATAMIGAALAAESDFVIRALRDNEVRLVVYVPDNVLRPLIDAISSDDYFTSFVATREEEAVGIVCGAAMDGIDVATLKPQFFDGRSL